jgi:uncharacterized membrane protein YecN with MAPEG domain
MILLPVTSVAAALLGLIGLALAARVTAARAQTKISLGDAPTAAYAPGEEHLMPKLTLAQRAHLNFCEYAPLALILLGLVEAAGAPRALCVALAAMLVAGRALHPFGIGRRAPNPFRGGGAFLTWLEMAVASVYLLYAAASGG